MLDGWQFAMDVPMSAQDRGARVNVTAKSVRAGRRGEFDHWVAGAAGVAIVGGSRSTSGRQGPKVSSPATMIVRFPGNPRPVWISS